MKWSWRIGRIAGIAINVHFTFLLLLAWIAARSLLAGRGWLAALEGTAFIVALFGCVVLHELGHALTARRFGIATRDITLLPIGGVARLERMPDRPMQELWVALAGPAVNVVIAGLLYVGLLAFDALPDLDALEASLEAGGAFLARLMFVNLALVVFNMLPAFPMDGGRVLRALLATRMDYVRATQIAATVGQALAFLLGFWGMLVNPFLMVIALFVWMGAAQEAAMVQMKSALAGVSVGRTMVSDFRTLAPTDPLRRAVDLILAGAQSDFPVLEEDRLAGLLTRNDLVAALATRGVEAPVREVMRRDVRTVDVSEMLETAFARLQESPYQTLPVTEHDRVVGLLTAENLGEFLMIRAALDRKASTIGNG